MASEPGILIISIQLGARNKRCMDQFLMISMKNQTRLNVEMSNVHMQ